MTGCSNAPARRCTSASCSGPTGSTATAPRSSRRSRDTTSSRPTGTSSSWGRRTSTRSRLVAEAASRLASAGRRAFVRGDMNAAANLLLRATSPLPPTEPRRLALFPDLGEALTQLGRFAEAASLLEDAVAMAEMAGEKTLAANARLVELVVRFLTGETEGWSEEATAVAEEAVSTCARGKPTTRAWLARGGSSPRSAAARVATAPRPTRSSARSNTPAGPRTSGRSVGPRRSTRSPPCMGRRPSRKAFAGARRWPLA